MSHDHKDVTPPFDPRQLDGSGDFQDIVTYGPAPSPNQGGANPNGGHPDGGNAQAGNQASNNQLTGYQTIDVPIGAQSHASADNTVSGHDDPHAGYAQSALGHAQYSAGQLVGASQSTVSVATTDAIEFRVFRDGSPVRRLRLGGHRYTFGAGKGCSIRLNDQALRPMHAVLVRDSQRILVRAYSVPIDVNGTRTSETTLSVGDIVTLGNYRFELISINAPTAAPLFHTDGSNEVPVTPAQALSPPVQRSAAQSDQAPPQTPSTNNTNQPVSGRQRESALSADPTLQSQDLLAQQLRREVQLWRSRQDDTERRDARCDERESKLFGRESELWTRAEQLQSRESALKAQESAALQIQEEYLRKQSELERVRNQSAAQEARFQTRENEFQKIEAEYQDQLDHATRQLQQSQEQAESATQAVTRMREQFASLNGQLEALTDQQKEIENHDAQRLRQHEEQKLHLEHARDEALKQRNLAHQERDQAIDGIARSEAKRKETERLLAEAQQRIQAERVAFEQEKAKLARDPNEVLGLQCKIGELNASIDSAKQETSMLRRQYADAVEAMAELERLNGEMEASGRNERTAWSIETDELRESIRQLSDSLASANGELDSLRQVNANLIGQVRTLTVDVQTVREDADNRVAAVEEEKNEMWLGLQAELDRANEQLYELKGVYDATLAEIDENALSKSSQGGTEAYQAAASINELAIRFDAKAAELAILLRGLTDDEADDPNRPVRLKSIPPADFVATSEKQAFTAHESWQKTLSAEADGQSNVPEPQSTAEATVPADTSAEVASEGSLADGYAEPVVTEPVVTEPAVMEPAVTEATPDSVPDQPNHDSAADTEPSWQSALSDVNVDNSLDQELPSGYSDPTTVAINPLMQPNGSTGYEEPDQGVSGYDMPTGYEQPTAEAYTQPETEEQTEPQAYEQTEPQAYEQTEPQAYEQTEPQAYEQTEPDPQPESYAEPEPQPEPPTDASWSALAHEPETTQPDSEATAYDDGGYNVEVQPADDHDDDTGSLASQLINDINNETQFSGVASTEYAETSQDEQALPREPETQPDEAHWSSAFSSNETDSEDGDSDDATLSAQQLAVLNASAELLDEQTHAVEQPESQGYSSAPVARSEPESEPVDEEEDSVEAYMNRLLGRMQTGPAKATVPAVEAESHDYQSADNPESVEEIVEEAEAFDPNEPLQPRSQAPEGQSLSAMRELANQSARSAISRSSKTQNRATQTKALAKFAQGVVALLCGAAAFIFVSGFLKVIAAGASVLIALICINEGLSLVNAKGNRPSKNDDNEPKPTSEQS